MDTKDWESFQERQQRRPGEETNSVPVRRLYPEPKKDRREPKEKKR